MMRVRALAVSLVVGIVLTMGITTSLSLQGPPVDLVPARPAWPEVRPIGWPAYTTAQARPGAGVQAEGQTGMAYSARAMGRALHLTHIYEIKSGAREIYTAAEFRAGLPLKASFARRFRMASGQTANDGLSVLSTAAAGYSVGTPQSAHAVIGPTIMLAFAPTAMALNVLFWSILAWCGLTLWMRWRTIWRHGNRECLQCSYPLGNAPICSECGAKEA